MLSRSRLSLSKNIQSCHLTGQPQMQFPKEGNLGYSHTLGGLMAAHTKTCCGHRIFHITILESSRSHPRQYSILYLIKTLHQSTPTQPAHFWHNPTTATALYQATKQHLNKLYSEKTWKMRWKAKPLICFSPSYVVFCRLCFVVINSVLLNLLCNWKMIICYNNLYK